MRFATLILIGIAPAGAIGQLTERPGCTVDHPIDTPRDPSGRSIKAPRVRIVHTTDPTLPGGSMYLQEIDPFLGYAWGRDLFQRSFRERDGVFGEAGKLDGPILPDGATRMMDRGHSSSCGSCHNVPYRDAGAGMTIPKNGGTGRNTPHLFGAGLVEMIGQHLRAQALALADADGNGWIGRAEAADRGCVIAGIDYGRFDDADGDGRPDLNPLFYPIYVDAAGRRIAFANDWNYPGVAGYTVQAQVFGFGHLYVPFRPPVSTTLRTFSVVPFDIHAGLQACDPTTHTHDGSPSARVSNAGCPQFITEAARDRGSAVGPTGISLDDPDRDGYLHEITEGDLDVIEWYLLNHPAPGRGRITPAVRRGEKLFRSIGCAKCHVPDWHLPDGDRRFFELNVAWNPRTDRLEGRLNHRTRLDGDRRVPDRRPVHVVGIYSDFKYHDVGEKFYQLQFDGSVVRQWRTPPLWGVGSTAPYGHDGADLDLDSVIRRHGGAAEPARRAYESLRPARQRDLIDFLNSLILYPTEQVPCDVDGDGRIAADFRVAGQNTGEERFNPEWLFRVPGRIEGDVRNGRGEPIRSWALTNLRLSYGLDLAYLRDEDGDGFPDVMDPEPSRPGYRDGVK